MNFTAEQLEEITKMIRHLNENETGMLSVSPYAIPVESSEDDNMVIGFLVDEIGGEYSFVPRGTKWFDNIAASLTKSVSPQF